MRVAFSSRRASGALVLATSIALGAAGAVTAYRTVAGPAPGEVSAPPALASEGECDNRGSELIFVEVPLVCVDFDRHGTGTIDFCRFGEHAEGICTVQLSPRGIGVELGELLDVEIGDDD